MNKQKITYESAGVNYQSLDPAKKLAQNAAKDTSVHLTSHGLSEISSSRGETAFVWKQGDTYMASVVESLGTKNLVADAMRKITGKTYYDAIGRDTVAAIINDLVAVGATPLTIHAFWAVGESEWFDDKERSADLVAGWKNACDIAKVTWGGGETPSYNAIVAKETIALGGSAVGIIKNEKDFCSEEKLLDKDRILFLRSSGINANGISLARSIASKLPEGYGTKLPSGVMFGEAILTPSNIYAVAIQELQKAGILIHYIANITGHGMRKLMRATKPFTYVLEQIVEPQEIFTFVQRQANLSDEEIYAMYNMGQDYALFIDPKDIKRAQEIVKENGFESIDAGYIKQGEKQVIITPKNITYKADRLDVR